MALQVSAILSAARSYSPLFDPQRVPDKVVTDFLTGFQRDLVARAVQRARGYLAQTAMIAIDTSSANAVGTVGAGTSGGVPLSATATTSAIPVQAAAGGLAELESDPAVVVSERVATAVTSTTITAAASGWTVDAYVDAIVEITAGPGVGQVRTVVSNTAETLTVAAWTTLPTTASTFRVLEPAIETDDTAGVVTSVPALASRTGYLVKLTSAGVAYLDYTQPLTVRYDVGVALPANHGILGGSLRYTDDATGEDSEPLTIVGYQQRFEAPARAVYVLADTLYLTGTSTDWADVEGIDLRYTPVPPAITRRTDYLLVPDAAYSAVVSAVAAFLARRVVGLGESAFDASAVVQEAARSEAAYLDNVSNHRRGRVRRIRDVS